MTRAAKRAIMSVVLVALLGLGGCGQGTSGATSTTGLVTGSGSMPATTSTSPTTATPSTTGTSPTISTPSTQPGAEGVALTPDQLAQFDGKEGRAAYVAVDGVIYDVSSSRSWPEGVHSRCDLGAMAGNDLSEVIRQAPANMRSLLERMPVVGRLVP